MKHPLEDLFNMEEGTTIASTNFTPEKDDNFIEQNYALEAGVTQAGDAVPTEPPKDVKDADDIETERKIDEVYNSAMNTFNNQIAYTEIIEPRYAARNAEVAANFLSIALNAAATKAKVKSERKRSNAAFIPYANGGKTTNNIVVADRNDILRMINIDGDVKEIK